MALVAAILLGLPALGLWCWLAGRDGEARLGRREAFAFAAVAWAAYSVLCVELLSLGAGHDLAAPRGGHLTRLSLVLVWTPPAAFGAAAAYRFRASAEGARAAATELWRTTDTRTRLCLATTTACVAIVGIVAVAAAPNNWDSMTYHLARVAAWVRLGGVSHYATSVEPQLYQPPGAEMLVAHWHVLTGGDRMDAVVQWFAFGGSAVVASLAAARLGAGRFGQAAAALLVVTMPMAIMQGSSTQNDLVTAFWLLIAATFALGIGEDERGAAARTIGACTAVGLAVVTKGTALIFGLPVIAMIAFCGLRHGRSRRRVAALLAGAVLVIAPSVQHALQNHDTYGSFLATGSTGNFYKNENAGPKTIVSNLARNASVHLNLPGDAPNRLTEKAIRNGLDRFGINADDPANTFEGRPFEVGKFGPHEDHAGNLALLFLSIWAVVAIACVSAFRTRRRLLWAAVICAQILLFCALLKWQVWHARLHLPAFVLAVPLVAACMAGIRRRRMVTCALALIVLAAPVYLFYNYTRPLVGGRSVLTTPRDAQYFLPKRNIEAPYRAVMRAIEDDRRTEIGLAAGIDDWVYPFQILAGEHGASVREVLVVNRSKRYPARLPDTVICVNCDAPRIAILTAERFKNRPFTVGPVAHDPYLDESEAAITLWER